MSCRVQPSLYQPAPENNVLTQREVASMCRIRKPSHLGQAEKRPYLIGRERWPPVLLPGRGEIEYDHFHRNGSLCIGGMPGDESIK